MKELANAGKLGNERVLTVKTPLDLGLQKQAEQAIESDPAPARQGSTTSTAPPWW